MLPLFHSIWILKVNSSLVLIRESYTAHKTFRCLRKRVRLIYKCVIYVLSRQNTSKNTVAFMKQANLEYTSQTL